jgi:hypothetical protein
MDYLHVLCMILMVLSCVLCMTLMVFIYVYYGLFVYTNLVDVISLFSTVFLFIDRFLIKFDRFLPKFGRESSGWILKKITNLSMKSTDNSAKPAGFRYSRFWLFLRRAFWPNFLEFHRIFPKFSKTDEIAMVRFVRPPNFIALLCHT